MIFVILLEGTIQNYSIEYNCYMKLAIFRGTFKTTKVLNRDDIFLQTLINKEISDLIKN